MQSQWDPFASTQKTFAPELNDEEARKKTKFNPTIKSIPPKLDVHIYFFLLLFICLHLIVLQFIYNIIQCLGSALWNSMMNAISMNEWNNEVRVVCLTKEYFEGKIDTDKNPEKKRQHSYSYASSHPLPFMYIQIVYKQTNNNNKLY